MVAVGHTGEASFFEPTLLKPGPTLEVDVTPFHGKAETARKHPPVR
jgi:hypothetical protein